MGGWDWTEFSRIIPGRLSESASLPVVLKKKCFVHEQNIMIMSVDVNSKQFGPLQWHEEGGMLWRRRIAAGNTYTRVQILSFIL